MKRFLHIILLFILCSACEDVIEVDPPSEPPRLYVDALIRVETNRAVTNVVILLGQTSSFFEDTRTAEGAQITIKNDDFQPTGTDEGNTITLSETTPGRYQGSKSTSFFTGGGVLELSIIYNGERYRALTEYVPAVPIDNLEQGDGELFSGEETEVLVSFTDNADREDFYLFDFDFGEYLVTDDGFYQGQTFEFSYFYDDGVESGREIEIELLGVDEPFYNYMNQLIVQAGGDQGPFQTPSATVRGNIVNVTGIEGTDNSDAVNANKDFALGYFAVCQVFSETITVE